MRPRRLLLFLSSLLALSCATPAGEDGDLGQHEDRWDSAGGNPTHATHAIYAEYAVAQVGAQHPEVRAFEREIVEGANLELHELPLDKGSKHEELEPLRQEIGGSNWAADRPEILWERARASYAAGDKPMAYLYVGIILHYVQDMGGPAHAFRVIHQSKPWNWDNVEMLGFFDFHGDLKRPPPAGGDPRLAGPVDYIEWSAARAREHFQGAFPGQTYHRTFIPQAYDAMSEEHWAFVRGRQTGCAHATAHALRSAAAALDGLPR